MTSVKAFFTKENIGEGLEYFDAGSDQTMCMKSVRFLSRDLPQLCLALAGLSFLLAACASSNQKSANVASPFPQNFNSGARTFEGSWPYGHEDYR